MQMAVKKARQAKHNPEATNLMELKRGESGILDRLDLPEDDARRLMELGFLPGHAITPGHSAPGGDPRVFRVDGSEVALRRDTARKLILRQGTAAKVSGYRFMSDCHGCSVATLPPPPPIPTRRHIVAIVGPP